MLRQMFLCIVLFLQLSQCPALRSAMSTQNSTHKTQHCLPTPIAHNLSPAYFFPPRLLFHPIPVFLIRSESIYIQRQHMSPFPPHYHKKPSSYGGKPINSQEVTILRFVFLLNLNERAIPLSLSLFNLPASTEHCSRSLLRFVS
jgi:hypothetical protein